MMITNHFSCVTSLIKVPLESVDWIRQETGQWRGTVNTVRHIGVYQ